MRRLLVLLAAVTLIGASSLAPSAASARQPHVFPPTAHAFGASLGEWQARWFTWFIEIPAPTNPLFDETGALRDQPEGPVWFLAPVAHPGLATRACTVPVGAGIFVLGLGKERSNIEPPPFFGATEAELRACAADGYEAFFGDATQSISVDGVEVADLSLTEHRRRSSATPCRRTTSTDCPGDGDQGDLGRCRDDRPATSYWRARIVVHLEAPRWAARPTSSTTSPWWPAELTSSGNDGEGGAPRCQRHPQSREGPNCSLRKRCASSNSSSKRYTAASDSCSRASISGRCRSASRFVSAT